MKSKAHFFNNISSESPYLLNLSKSLGNDFIGSSSPVVDYYLFSGAFEVEAEFEYSLLDASYACIFGSLTVGSAFRVLINNTTILVSMNINSNMSYSKATSFNTKYSIKVRRDASDDVFVSLDNEPEVNIGSRTGNVSFNALGNADIGSGRYLTGKIYRFNINGEEFPCNEGSGGTITGDLGTTIPITTSNAGGQTYIDNTMWELI